MNVLSPHSHQINTLCHQRHPKADPQIKNAFQAAQAPARWNRPEGSLSWVMKVANRDGGVNSWKKRGLNAIKPWMKQPRDRLCAVHRATPSPQVVKHVAKGINVRRRTDRRI